LLAGILWGARAGLPNDLQQTMKSAGITHIIAISGYNVSLITVALANWLVLIGLSKKQMAGIILVVLFAFVVITGASASVMRAAIMGGFIVVVKLVQRKARPIVVLPLALFVMGLFNPLALLYDAGLHLSFLATVGLLVVNPLLEKKLPAKTPGWLKESAVTTFSATLMTAPYSWWQFGQLTLAGLVTNLLVVPIVPCVMAIGALAVGFYFILPILSLPWATIVHFLLATIIYFAKVTSEIPSL
jgi:competence protein ComEC